MLLITASTECDWVSAAYRVEMRREPGSGLVRLHPAFLGSEVLEWKLGFSCPGVAQCGTFWV